MLADYLSDEQIAEARRLWSKGLSLIDIAEALGEDCRGMEVGIYHLSPWLYAGSMREAMHELRGFAALRQNAAPAPAFTALLPTWRARIGW